MTPIPFAIPEAAAVLRSGGVIAYPTEAVWGLGCDPRNEQAVMRLLAIKQRGVEKGLILIAARLEQLRRYVDLAAVPPDRLADVLAGWPGPHTWIMPASDEAPRWITGAHAGIAVRVTAHADVIALCDAFGGALVSTSANRAGQPAVHAREALDRTLLTATDGLLHGETGGAAAPTSIRDALSGATIRQA